MIPRTYHCIFIYLVLEPWQCMRVALSSVFRSYFWWCSLEPYSARNQNGSPDEDPSPISVSSKVNFDHLSFRAPRLQSLCALLLSHWITVGHSIFWLGVEGRLKDRKKRINLKELGDQFSSGICEREINQLILSSLTVQYQGLYPIMVIFKYLPLHMYVAEEECTFLIPTSNIKLSTCSE